MTETVFAESTLCPQILERYDPVTVWESGVGCVTPFYVRAVFETELLARRARMALLEYPKQFRVVTPDVTNRPLVDVINELRHKGVTRVECHGEKHVEWSVVI